MNATASLDLPLDIPLKPHDDPEPRAVWATAFAPTHPNMTFAEAMTIERFAHAITQVSLKRARRIAGQCK